MKGGKRLSKYQDEKDKHSFKKNEADNSYAKNIYGKLDMSKIIQQLDEQINLLTNFQPGVKLYTRLDISNPGDAVEVNADGIAKAMESNDAASVQTEVEKSNSKFPAQANNLSFVPSAQFEEKLLQIKGSGFPLDQQKQMKFEELLGMNLDNIRLHTGKDAKDLSESINAKAFVYGNEIFFSDNHNDAELLAHELAHIIQRQNSQRTKIFRAGKEIILTDNVGKGQKNLAGDVVKIQDALYKLGYAIPLNEWDLSRETDANTALVEAIPGTSMAITEFQLAHFSNVDEDKKGWLSKTGETLKRINSQLIVLESGVGSPSEKKASVKNLAADVNDVQDALIALGYKIPESERPSQDQIDSNTAMDGALLVETGKAIMEFQKNNIPGIKEENLSTYLFSGGGQTLSKLNQKLEQKDHSSSFKSIGRTIALKQPVGKGQKNRAEDVRSLQKVLLLLGYSIDKKEIIAEEVAADSVIAEVNLDSTIKAIIAFQTDHFGPKPAEYPKYGWVGIEGGQTLKTLNNLLVVLEGPVGSVKHQNANMSRDVLSVQEALIQLGYTIPESEKPIETQLKANEIIEISKLTETIKAIITFQETNFVGVILKGYLIPDGASVIKLNVLLNEKTKLPVTTTTENTEIKDDINTGDDVKPTVVATVPKNTVENTVEVEGVGDDMDSNVDVNEKLGKTTSATHQEPTSDYLKQIKKNRETGFTTTNNYLNVALRGYSLKGPVGDSSNSTANHKDDLIMIQDALVNMEYLGSSNAENERPAKMINDDKNKKTPVYNYTDNTTYFNKGSIKKTIAALTKFQKKYHVSDLSTKTAKKSQLVEMGMTADPSYQAGIVTNKDATYITMTNVARFSVAYVDYAGKSKTYSLRNFTYSGFNKARLKDSYMDTGKIKPNVVNFPSNDLELFTGTGLTNTQAKAMMWVSANEGGFDALNTYDDQIISVGYAQLAGRFSFEKYLAMIKYREPELFKTYFLNYGIDVEFKMADSKIMDDSVKLYVYDPDSKTEDGKMMVDVLGKGETDDNAKKYLVSHPVLLAAFNKAIQDPRIKKVMIELTVRSYAFPAQDKEANIPILDYIQVTENTTNKKVKVTKKVINEYFDAEATSFVKDDKVDPVTNLKYSALKKADRISEPDKASIRIGDIIRSEMGLAQLYDWAVHLNYPRAANIMADGIRGYAATKGYTKKSEYLAINELEVLKWLKNSFGTGWDKYAETDAKKRLEKILTLSFSPDAKKNGRTYEYHNLSSTK
ncbi:hypothetical protein BH11BAC7_BH11BAC7_02480 [soil metagenome]